MIQEGKFYITFAEEITENQPLKFEFPKNSLGRIFDFNFFDNETIELFENRSLMDLLKYYKNFYNFTDNLRDQIDMKKLKDLTYNVNLQNIYLSGELNDYSALNEGD